MYHIQIHEDGIPIYELVEAQTDSRFRIAPQRGGMMTGLVLHGQELLYMDRSTFLDPSANVRGGNPVLFPISGQLHQGEYAWNGRRYRMGNHGFARNLPWEIVETRTDGEASITLRLTATDWTREQFPFSFELLFTYRLKDARLTIEQRYRHPSPSGEAMPMYPGFHPYFAIDPQADTVKLYTEATRIYEFDGTNGRPFAGELLLSDARRALMLPDNGVGELAFAAEKGTRVRIRYDRAFRYIVLWTAEAKPFLCVEPWMAKSGEYHRGQELVSVAPGEELQTWMSIEAFPSEK